MSQKAQFFHLLFLILVTAVCAAYKCDTLKKEIAELRAQITAAHPLTPSVRN